MALLTERLAAQPGGPAGSLDPTSLTPGAVNALPEAVKSAVVTSYNEALTPVLLFILPLMIIAAVALCFIEEKPLPSPSHTGRTRPPPLLGPRTGVGRDLLWLWPHEEATSGFHLR